MSIIESSSSDTEDDGEDENDEEENIDNEENVITLEEELKEKIKELLFYKVELPSSSSNKLIVNTLENLLRLMENVENDNLHKVKFAF
jgi:hypothetical protein